MGREDRADADSMRNGVVMNELIGTAVFVALLVAGVLWVSFGGRE